MYVGHAARLLQKANCEARENRMKQRAYELKVDWKRDGGRKCYMAVKEPPPPPTLVLSREDRTITANPKEMHELINRCWVEGVFNKKDTSAQFQDWLDFAEEGQVNGLDYQDLMRAWKQHHQSTGGLAGEFPLDKIDAS